MRNIEIYSLLTPAQALDGSQIIHPLFRDLHQKMLPYLCLIDVWHIGYDTAIKQGQLVVHEEMRDTFKAVFEGLIDLRYPFNRSGP